MPRYSAPQLPSWTLARPRLEERLDEGAGRRLTAIVAGAGYGKSTLVARWADARTDTTWYSLDAIDRSLSYLVRGVATALEPFIGGAPADLRAVIAAGASSAEEGDPARADAVADLMCELLAERVTGDCLLVVDDLQEIVGSVQSIRFIESLLRGAPPSFHLVLVSRGTVPFGIERLRGQGQVIELGADRLAFTEDETAALLAHLGDDGPRLAPRLHAVTSGWPAAVRLAAEALLDVAPAGRPAVIERLGRPEGPLFAYIAEEVLGHESEPVLAFLRSAARLEWFDASLLEAVGVADAAEILAELRRRALFIDFDQHDETYAVHKLLRGVIVDQLPLTATETADLNRRAARWFEEQGRLRQALGACLATGDPALIIEFLARHDQRLLSEGVIDGVVRAVEIVPAARRPRELELLLADALIARGDFDAAIQALGRAGGDAPRRDPAIAWRIAMIHHQRGQLGDAEGVFEGAARDRGSPADVALLLGWQAYAVWTVSDPKPLRDLAERALMAAEQSGDDRALAVAYLAGGAHANARGDPGEAVRLFTLANAAASRAGWALLIARAHNDLGFHLVREGRFAEALREDDAAVTILRAMGDASFQALALADRGEAHLGLGHFEEALADFEASIALYDRIGSRWKAWTMVREATLYRMRGETALARSRYEAGLRIAQSLGDEMAHSEILAGLALVIAKEDPAAARELADQAIEVGRHGYQVTGLLAAARLAVDRGDRVEAAILAAELDRMARSRHDRPALAGALEVLAQVSADPVERRARLDEASALWAETGSPFGLASCLLVRSRILTGGEALEAALEAERILREIGARGLAADAAARVLELRAAAVPPVVVGALGGFRVLRDGTPVAVAEWQSKKARDLLKILVARRGRPISREALFEALWPEEEPEPLANRLSVALTTVRSVLDPLRRFPPEHFIVADKTSVALDLDHLTTDVETFFALAERGRTLATTDSDGTAFAMLTEAEATYAGDFLEEDPYEDWAAAIREEAQATYLGVARALAAMSAARGDVDGAIRLWLRVLEKDQFDEGAHLELVGMLNRAGRHGEARRRFGIYVERMAEIGVEAAPFPTPLRAA
jgi:ATP/maltotriose-dependent transcriptional regulator MalT/DNA-binding SARP family transcriptional activator